MRRLVLIILLALPLLAREIEPARRAEGRAVILHPAHALTEADEADLASRGVTIKQALPGGRYLARITEDADVTNDARIISVEPLTVEKKLHRTAIREAARSATMGDFNVVFHRDVPFEEARQAILAAGGTMDVFALDYLPSQRIRAKIPTQALTALAADDRVLTIAGARRLKLATNNLTTAAVSHVTDVQKAPYGLTGAGVVVSLFELAAPQASHVEFGGRLTVAPTTMGGPSAEARHATHVAGTIGAAGVRADAKGMAPGATIHVFCVPVAGFNSCTGGEWQQLKAEKLKPLGVKIDNNSWGYIWGWQDGSPPLWNDGDLYWGAYDLELASPIDQVSNDTGVLFVHSSGNDGEPPFAFRFDAWKAHHHVDVRGNTIPNQTFCVSQNGSGTDCPASCNGATNPCELQIHHPQLPFDTMGTTASAKNVIAVGAVTAGRELMGLSSRGPAKDGRVKPDVVARGANVLSSVPTDSYATLNGTSMSSPAVAGIAALLVEQWRRTFLGQSPTPAQLKGLIIAGADELGNPGPDYSFGFGLANAKASVDLLRDDLGVGARIRNLTFAQGSTDTHEVALVVEQTQDLRVVLNWSDPAIPFLGGDDDIAEEALVNDIDMRIIDPAGNPRMPYVLDRVNYLQNATRGVNTVDNVEMIEIASATPGVYRVIATGKRVTQGPQAGVLISNARTARPCFDSYEGGPAPFGNIVSGARINAGFCAEGDVDSYKFVATKAGPVSVTVTTGGTAVRVTLSGNGIARTQDIPANSTATLSADATTVPNTVTIQIEPVGPLSIEPQYSFVPTFLETTVKKRRSSRS